MRVGPGAAVQVALEAACADGIIRSGEGYDRSPTVAGVRHHGADRELVGAYRLLHWYEL